jgi:hypothetical protein
LAWPAIRGRTFGGVTARSGYAIPCTARGEGRARPGLIEAPRKPEPASITAPRFTYKALEIVLLSSDVMWHVSNAGDVRCCEVTSLVF